MASESSTKSLGRNRAPRVHIGYDVDTGNAVEQKEIPFIMGVFADLSGDRGKELPEVADRPVSTIDANSFDQYMKEQKPRVLTEVDNTLTGQGKLKVDMNFDSMDDFSPAAIAKKVDGLKELYEARCELQSLLNKIESKPKLEKALASLIGNPELADRLKALLAKPE